MAHGTTRAMQRECTMRLTELSVSVHFGRQACTHTIHCYLRRYVWELPYLILFYCCKCLQCVRIKCNNTFGAHCIHEYKPLLLYDFYGTWNALFWVPLRLEEQLIQISIGNQKYCFNNDKKACCYYSRTLFILTWFRRWKSRSTDYLPIYIQ